ncbi:MAG TPA: ankyrin repeat domain-containing protein, partial [Pseudonocardia sp.]|nr:ankyrin repeat domain-containing protein [Pseudonocardia sp.]
MGMPVMGLPGTDLDQLRRQAKEWLRRGRSGDPEAVSLLRQFHPRGAELAADPSRLRLADAQLALARAYDFPSWPKLRQHLLLVQPWRRNPHQVGERDEPADELVRLACLTYGADDSVRPARAAALLEANPELGGSSAAAAAATGSVAALRAVLADDPAAVEREGGPYQWTPLLYLCFSRIPDAPPERAGLACARLLLEAGANPDAGFLWEGLAPPFTALTGAFGGGEDRANQPPHAQALSLARLLLEAGADPNDGQTLYNRMFEADDDHLRLLFQYGLGQGDGGPWRRRLGEVQQTPTVMLADQLIWAVQAGRRDRVALLLSHGVDPNHPGGGHPTHQGRTALEWALRTGSTELAALLADAGARPPADLDPVDALLAAALAGNAEAVGNADPRLLVDARRRRPLAVA